jgi:hypothetical protein
MFQEKEPFQIQSIHHVWLFLQQQVLMSSNNDARFQMQLIVTTERKREIYLFFCVRAERKKMLITQI